MGAEYGTGYLLGVLIGIFAGAVLVAVLLKLTKKDGSIRCRYDERQEVIRGRGFKYSFFTMLIYFAAETLFGEFLELFAERSVISFIGLCLGVAVYAVYGIWRDAYISLNENPKRVVIVFFVVAAANFVLSIRHFLHGDLIVDGALGMNGINLICGILMTLIAAAIVVRRLCANREADCL